MNLCKYVLDFLSKQELNRDSVRRLYKHMKKLAKEQPHLHSRESEQVGILTSSLYGVMFDRILKKYATPTFHKIILLGWI